MFQIKKQVSTQYILVHHWVQLFWKMLKYDRSSFPEVFCKKVFLEIAQNSQENTCARVFFLTFIKKETLA